MEFAFDGAALTDAADQKTEQVDLEVVLRGETCDWLIEPVVRWLRETVAQTVAVEFDRYIAAGDLEAAKERLARIEAASDQGDGFLGMYL